MAQFERKDACRIAARAFAMIAKDTRKMDAKDPEATLMAIENHLRLVRMVLDASEGKKSSKSKKSSKGKKAAKGKGAAEPASPPASTPSA